MNPLTIHPLCSSHSVLQRDCRLPIRGTAAPGTTVRVMMCGQESSATADANGSWVAWLDPLPAGGPHTLVAKAGHDEVVATDVLVGDVFLCSGQSNMEWPLRDTEGGSEAAAVSADPSMRLLTVPRRTCAEPSIALDAKWIICGPETSPAFSAVAYYGGRKLRQAYSDVPVGLICAAWGGTRIEPWMSPSGLQVFPAEYNGYREVLESIQQANVDPAEQAKRLEAIRGSFIKAFTQWHHALCEKDGGEAAGYNNPNYSIQDWQDRQVPGFWPDESLGNHEGVVWFACDFDLPSGWNDGPVVLHLGEVDNEDTTWINGVRIGAINALDGMDHWSKQRDYPVPSGVLKTGRNRLTVRVIDYGGRGGLGGGPHGLCLEDGSGRTQKLPSLWKVKIGAKRLSPMVPYPAGWSGGVDANLPCALFNGMIAPLVPTALAGIWWYQGESNVREARRYRDLMKGLIKDWRRHFLGGSTEHPLPFFWVQLAPFMPPSDEPDAGADWALLREAQTLALSLPATGQAVILDCGDANDVHPRNKRTPGERVAALVLHARGKKVPTHGPRFASVENIENKLRVKFGCSGRLRTTNDKPVARLAIAGTDRVWRWAQSELHGDALMAWHNEIARPVAVRYAWADNPDGANLTDDTGLPAWPFRSDTWDDA